MQVLCGTISHRFLRGYWRLRQHFVTRVNPRLKAEVGLEIPEIMLLHFSAASDLAPGEIAASMGLAPHVISRRLEQLERRGLLERRLDPEDARRRVLHVTEAGHELLARALTALEREVNAVLERLPDEGLESFIGALEALVEDDEADPSTPQDAKRQPQQEAKEAP